MTTPDLTIPTLPVICEKCRDTGILGEGPFSALPDIMNFTPVERRAHVNGWRPEHQRAFIAALAITGSARQAARAIGRHAFGAEQLRNHRAGKSFAAAWDAAVELARDREAHRICENLASLAKDCDTEARSQSGGLASTGSAVRPNPVTDNYPPGYDPEFDDAERLEYLESKQRIRERLLRARRLLLMLLSSHPEKRAAWEELCGPVDWDKAANLEAEDGEAYARPGPGGGPMTSARDADFLITAEAGFLPEMTGGRDGVAEIIEEARRLNAAGVGQPPGDP